MPRTVKPAAPSAPKVKLDPDVLKLKGREPAYTLDPKCPKVQVSPGTFVTRGVRVNGGVPSLVFVDGSRQTGLPFAVIATALLGAVIPDAEVQAIYALRA